MISVCMATYNGEKYVKEQIDSILKQLGPDDELIISDDGSKDNTCSIIEAIDDIRIKLVSNIGTHGFTHNFENALSRAKGDYIFLSDQDDIWLDGKVSSVMEALQRTDFVTHDCITVDSELKVLSDSRFAEFNVKPGFWRHMFKSRYLGCCMAFTRRLLDVAMPFPQNDLLVEHDIWLAAIGFMYFNVEEIESPLINYRRHGENASSGGFTKGYSMSLKIKKRVYRLVELIKIRYRVMNRRENHAAGGQHKS